ncbi:MAG TPA: gamma-glutamylcyclotransferase family protein [Erythrobacter sp.]
MTFRDLSLPDDFPAAPRHCAGMHRLFSYGTLQLPDVQREVFGGSVAGVADALVGYVLDEIEIADPGVVGLSGIAVHKIARATGDPADRVPGVVFTIDDAQLARADAYEGENYVRVEVDLASGRSAFLYARAG